MEPSIASLLETAERGEDGATEALFQALYGELHRMARREIALRGKASTLGVTTLLHEAYLDMAARSGTAFPDQPRFMKYAARVMRGLIIDHARNRHAAKRGGQFQITSLPTEVPEEAVDHAELTRIGEALDQLATVEPSLAEIVDLKFFCGFSFGEIAAMHGVSERTVRRQWERARVYLHRTINPASES